MSVLLNLPPIPSSYKFSSSCFLLACILHVSIQFHFSIRLAGWLEVTLQNEICQWEWNCYRDLDVREGNCPLHPFPLQLAILFSSPFNVSVKNWGASSCFCQALSSGLGRKRVSGWSVRHKPSCTSKLGFSGPVERTSPSTWEPSQTSVLAVPNPTATFQLCFL